MFRTIGQRITLKPFAGPAERTRPVAGKKVYLGVDVPLLLVVVTLAIFGALMVYSASYDYSQVNYGSPTYMFERQMLWLALGIGVVVFLTFFDYHRWRKLIIPAMAFTIVSLILVLIVNEVRNGAVRTFLNGSIQPSELANIVTIIYLSVWLFSKRDQLGDVGFGLFPLAAILGFLFALIFLQPDLSAAMTILFLGGMMFFLAGGELRQILIVLVVALVIGFIIVQLTATGTNRMGLYLAGLKDPTQASYHVRRSVEAFVKGKWLGVGIGMSETKLTGLPYPSTDSIFAVIGEETGILGSVALIALYVLLLWRGLTIARRAPDNLGTLLAGGLTLWIAMEAFINMAVMVNLMPFAGNALPFISSGGSNLLVSFAAVGILMNISRSSAQIRKEEGRLFSAVVDLRRRDRRRSVSGARGSSGPDFEG